MIIIKVIGGLGNQMFQYAFYLSLRQKGFDAKIDISQLQNYKLHDGYQLEEIFNIKPKIATLKEVSRLSRNYKNELFSRIIKKIPFSKPSEYTEKIFYMYDPEVYKIKRDTYFEGYWQNEDYFKSIRNEILTNFTFKIPLSEINNTLLEEIIHSNSVSIHVRRGDYLKDNQRNNICTPEYYKLAIEKMETKINRPLYFVFSDDIAWCKTNLPTNNYRFIDWNLKGKSFVDMQLMCNCKHNIIANSSFSWWAAWLNKNENKNIISPSTWIMRKGKENIIPEKWLKI